MYMQIGLCYKTKQCLLSKEINQGLNKNNIVKLSNTLTINTHLLVMCRDISLSVLYLPLLFG